MEGSRQLFIDHSLGLIPEDKVTSDMTVGARVLSRRTAKLLRSIPVEEWGKRKGAFLVKEAMGDAFGNQTYVHAFLNAAIHIGS